MPASIDVKVLNDRSVSIRNAILDVKHTLLLTVALVIMVIFLFLKRLSATVIPVLSLPISLIGCCGLMRWLGYSLDNISLLGITIAVGLVVDDAIVMLENIVRHMEEGMEPLAAALKGSREVSFTILSISISLVAVFIPILFKPGVIGLMFHVFAAVVSLAILVSALVSLTLVPMLCSRYLRHEAHEKAHEKNSWLSRGFEQRFHALLTLYARALDWSLAHGKTVLAVALGSFALTVLLFAASPKGFFPSEDIGQISGTVEGPQDISYPAMVALLKTAVDIIQIDPNVATVASRINIGNTGFLFIGLKPRDKRKPMEGVIQQLRRKLSGVPGMAVYM